MPGAIPPEFQEFVRQELTTGKYRSADEVVAEGLRLLRGRKLHELRRDIDAGLAELDGGKGVVIEDSQSLREFFDDIGVRGLERLQSRRPE
jgi:putative addiction module CopG family antidote